MKKNYIAPKMVSVDLELEGDLLTPSTDSKGNLTGMSLDWGNSGGEQMVKGDITTSNAWSDDEDW